MPEAGECRALVVRDRRGVNETMTNGPQDRTARATASRATAGESPGDPDATVVMPVVEVKPLSQKTEEARQRLIEEAMAKCEHVAWEVSGEAKLPGNRLHEHRKCTDCGHSWTVTTDAPPTEEEWEAVKPEPPKVVYGGGRIVTYQTKHGQHDLVVDELAIVTIQAGVLVVQHVESEVAAIVGVRPWMQEEVPHADPEV